MYRAGSRVVLNTAVRLEFPSAEKMSAYKKGPVCPELIMYRKLVRNQCKNKERLKLTALSKMLMISNSFIRGSRDPG
jgi:hypothetical protein